MPNGTPPNLGTPTENDWPKWSMYVLEELKRQNTCMEAIKKRQNDHSVDLAMLKVRASVWGLLGGAIPAALMLIYWLLKGVVGGQ